MTVTFDPFIHEYSDENKRIILSVTQLLRKHELSPDYSFVNDEILEQASEKGTMVHSHFETGIKTEGQDDSDDPAVKQFLKEFYPQYANWQSEQMVWIDENANRIPLAGTLDLVCYAGDGRWLIGDIKTTSSLHMESISWQLSLYRLMWCYLNHVSANDVDLFCLHVRDGECKWHDVMPIPQEDLDQLFFCEAEDIPFFRSREVISETTEKRFLDYQQKLTQLTAEIERIENLVKAEKKSIFNTLYNQGIKTLETPLLKISVVAPTTSTTIDSKRLKAEMPEIYEQFSKTSMREGYVRISAK